MPGKLHGRPASRLLRIGLAAFSVYVLSDILPISFTHWNTGSACPEIGPVPACYLISICYASMGFASVLSATEFRWVFLVAVTPVILLALSGTVLEITGTPTCPVSSAGTPLCFYSLAAGVGMLVVFLFVLWLEGTPDQP